MGRVIDFSSRCLEDEWSGNAFVINCLFFNAVTIALSFFIVPFSTTWQHHLSLVGYLLCINNDWSALPLLKVNYLIITYPRPLLIRLLQSIPITFMTVEKKNFKDVHTLILEFSLKFICSTTASTDWKMEWKNMSSTFIDS